MSDIKYLNQISHQLSLFEKTTKRYKFRCPFCGDNKKHLTKTNGSVYEVNDKLIFKCYLCQMEGFGDLLKQVNPKVFDEYMREKYPSHKSSQKENLLEHEKQLRKIENDNLYKEKLKQHKEGISWLRKHLFKLEQSIRDELGI